MFRDIPERTTKSIHCRGRLEKSREIGGVSTGSYCSKIKCTPLRALSLFLCTVRHRCRLGARAVRGLPRTILQRLKSSAWKSVEIDGHVVEGALEREWKRIVVTDGRSIIRPHVHAFEHGEHELERFVQSTRTDLPAVSPQAQCAACAKIHAGLTVVVEAGLNQGCVRWQRLGFDPVTGLSCIVVVKD